MAVSERLQAEVGLAPGASPNQIGPEAQSLRQFFGVKGEFPIAAGQTVIPTVQVANLGGSASQPGTTDVELVDAQGRPLATAGDPPRLQVEAVPPAARTLYGAVDGGSTTQPQLHGVACGIFVPSSVGEIYNVTFDIVVRLLGSTESDFLGLAFLSERYTGSTNSGWLANTTGFQSFNDGSELSGVLGYTGIATTNTQQLRVGDPYQMNPSTPIFAKPTGSNSADNVVMTQLRRRFVVPIMSAANQNDMCVTLEAPEPGIINAANHSFNWSITFEH